MTKLAFVAQPEYFRFIYEHDLDEYWEVKEFPFKFNMTENDFSDLVDYGADFNFFFRGEFFPEPVLKRINGLKINLSSEPFPGQIEGKLKFTTDSFRRYKHFKSIANKSYDYVFHYDESSIPFFNSENFKISGVFPFPVATSVYAKMDVEKKWDFFFIGRSTPHRERFFSHLKHSYNFLHICHGIWGPELVECINKSKILLNVHAENETSWEPRLQMLMATGNLVISEKISPNPFFKAGRDYVEVNTPRELFEAGEYYLHNERERSQIARHGYETVNEYLNSKKVFTRLVDEIKRGVYPKFQNQKVPPRNYKMEIQSLFLEMASVLRPILSRTE